MTLLSPDKGDVIHSYNGAIFMPNGASPYHFESFQDRIQCIYTSIAIHMEFIVLIKMTVLHLK